MDGIRDGNRWAANNCFFYVGAANAFDALIILVLVDIKHHNTTSALDAAVDALGTNDFDRARWIAGVFGFLVA